MDNKTGLKQQTPNKCITISEKKWVERFNSTEIQIGNHKLKMLCCFCLFPKPKDSRVTPTAVQCLLGRTQVLPQCIQCKKRRLIYNPYDLQYPNCHIHGASTAQFLFDVSINLKGILSCSAIAHISAQAQKKIDVWVMNNIALYSCSNFLFTVYQERIINLTLCKVGQIILYINLSFFIFQRFAHQQILRCVSYIDKLN